MIAALGGTLALTHGMYDIAAGSAEIAAGVKDDQLDVPSPTQSIASGFTSNKDYLEGADALDQLLFSGYALGMPKVSLGTDSLGFLGDLDTSRGYINYWRSIHSPITPHTPRQKQK